MDCLFCKIVEKKLPADGVYETDDLMVFKDIHPKSPIHLLIVPKMSARHIDSVNDLEPEDEKTIAAMFLAAKKTAEDFGMDETGYKLVFNVGRGGGQLIDHLHLHLLGGWKAGEKGEMP